MKNRIAVVNSSSFGQKFPKHILELKKWGELDFLQIDSMTSGKKLASILKEYQYVISSVTPIFDKEFFDFSPQIKLISRHGIGYNNVDIESANKNKCYVTIVTPKVERDAVAENTIANLLAMLRRTDKSVRAAENGDWQSRADFVGSKLSNKVVGVIGCGNIGSRVAEILKYGFNTEILVYDPMISMEWLKKNSMKQVDLIELLKKSEIICLNASLNKTSFQILNEKSFSIMKKGVYIINTARGALVDEKELLSALSVGIVEGYATDVMLEEPPSNDHPFFKHPKVLVTPHTSAYTIECLKEMGEKCIDDIISVMSDTLPENCVTTF